MVVDDVDAYVRRFEEYGIEPWGVMEVGPEHVGDMTSRYCTDPDPTGKGSMTELEWTLSFREVG
jgi:hypothetical protein